VTVTNGEATLRYRRFASSDEQASAIAGRLRAIDPIACGLWAGVPRERIISLGHYDGMVEKSFRHSPAGIEPLYGEGDPKSWHELVAQLRSIIERNSITVVCTPHPLLDSHPDHVFSTLAVLKAVLLEPRPNIKLLLYTNHHPQTEAYPFGPMHSATTVPPAQGVIPATKLVFSHPLDADSRHEKILALEMNHGLRDVPMPSRGIRRSAVDLLRRAILGSHLYDFNYYRRSIRQNELFFLATGSDIERLYEATMEAIRQPGELRLAPPRGSERQALK
jgi:LmbE family N-acetylglucosaminyl deacetylase